VALPPFTDLRPCLPRTDARQPHPRGSEPASSGASVLFWDIDGTLLSTARAGVFALEDAAEALTGSRPDFSTLQTSGLTDHAIAALALEHQGVDASEAAVHDFIAIYEQRLPERLPLRRGMVMPGVEELLGALSGRPEVLSLLLTGNTAVGARAKLGHYGLARYFDGGAFSVDLDARDSIARRAHALATERLGHAPSPERTFVIGDTPHDVDAGRAIGARTVAVATGTYALAELEACEPWWALASLPDPPAFAAAIGLPVSS
jgi:phosphoglycolate phosphatase-like HAD superfamily hydrolase